MSKKPKKQTPQQIFNQFLFNSMMDKLRAVELYEKEVAGYNKQISQHVKDHRENAGKVQTWIDETNEGITSLLKALPDIEILKTQVNGIEEWKKTLQQRLNIGSGAIDRIDAIEAKMKEQRGDYHDHIAQLVRENAAAHKVMQDQIAALQMGAMEHDVSSIMKSCKNCKNNRMPVPKACNGCECGKNTEGHWEPKTKKPAGRPKKVK